jgi:hypothetical protein
MRCHEVGVAPAILDSDANVGFSCRKGLGRLLEDTKNHVATYPYKFPDMQIYQSCDVHYLTVDSLLNLKSCLGILTPQLHPEQPTITNHQATGLGPVAAVGLGPPKGSPPFRVPAAEAPKF